MEPKTLYDFYPNLYEAMDNCTDKDQRREIRALTKKLHDISNHYRVKSKQDTISDKKKYRCVIAAYNIETLTRNLMIELSKL